jgi:hypothetical protein
MTKEVKERELSNKQGTLYSNEHNNDLSMRQPNRRKQSKKHRSITPENEMGHFDV